MLKYLLCVVLIVLIFAVAHQIILNKSNKQENFSSGSLGTSVGITSPDLQFFRQASIVGEQDAGSAPPSTGGSSSGSRRRRCYTSTSRY